MGSIDDKITHLPVLKIDLQMKFDNAANFKGLEITSKHKYFEIAEISGTSGTYNVPIKRIVYVAGIVNEATGNGLLVAHNIDANLETLIEPKLYAIKIFSDYRTISTQ